MRPLQREHPRIGATAQLVEFVARLKYDGLSDAVRHHARRHLVDTAGVMIAGAQGELAGKAQRVLAAGRSGGEVPVPGCANRAVLLDAAYLGGTAAHGIEFDDGFRRGSVHPGCVVLPAALAAAYAERASGAALIEAIVAGYETVIAVGAAVHPDLRRRGFHPTGVVGVFGAGMAAGKLYGLSSAALGHALGMAASGAAGLFAVNGGRMSNGCTPVTRRAKACWPPSSHAKGFWGRPTCWKRMRVSCTLSWGTPARRSRFHPCCPSASRIAT
jgi:2-methylcitrate dehydratase PrpD